MIGPHYVGHTDIDYFGMALLINTNAKFAVNRIRYLQVIRFEPRELQLCPAVTVPEYDPSVPFSKFVVAEPKRSFMNLLVRLQNLDVGVAPTRGPTAHVSVNDRLVLTRGRRIGLRHLNVVSKQAATDSRSCPCDECEQPEFWTTHLCSSVRLLACWRGA